MSDPLQVTSRQAVSDRTIDRTMLDRVILRHSHNVQGAGMEGETVLLDVSTSRYYTLNQMGSVIWEYCTGQHTSATFIAFYSTVFKLRLSRRSTTSLS